jgi:outer membrane protein assembly factor BamB
MSKLPPLIVLLFLVSSAAHGELLWQFSAGGIIAGNPVVHQDSVYVAGGNSLHVLNKKGEQQWTYDTVAPTRSTVAVSDDAIFILADNGLHALDKTGKRLWLFETTDGPLKVEGTTMGWGEGKFTDPWAWYRSAPLVVDSKVVFANQQGTYALDAKTGEQLWHAKTGTTHTRPVYHEGIVVLGSWDNYLYGLNINDGSIAWKVASRLPGGEMAGWLGWEGFNLDPFLHNGVVYAGNRGTHFYAIDAKSGNEKWSWKHASSWVGSPAVVSDEVIYFGMSDGYSLIGLETRMGNQSLLFRNGFYNFARPQANDRQVFMASVSGELFAVEKLSGQGQRIFATKGSKANLAELQSPTGGVKFLHSAEGGYTHENATKDVNHMFSMLDSLISLTLAGDTLYAGSANGNLYAVSIR